MRSFKEQPDDLACVGGDFLANDDSTRQLVNKADGTLDRVVIGHAEDIDLGRLHSLEQFLGSGGGVAGPHRVEMHVDSHHPRRNVRREMWMSLDGFRRRPGHAQEPDSAMPSTTSDTAPVPPGKYSKSPPTSTMSSRNR